jgi:IS30 family transposase
MPFRLTADEKTRIRELAKVGMPQHAIAKLFGRAESTIHNAIHGKKQHTSRDLDPNAMRSLAERCPGCGGMVYVWPCLYCMSANW